MGILRRLSVLLLPLILGAWTPIQLKEAYVTYDRFLHPGRSALIYPEGMKEGLALDLNNRVLVFGYLEARVHALTTSSQYRSVGLVLRMGVEPVKWLQVGVRHHSQHLLERQHAFMNRFPVEDSLEVRLYLYRE